MGDLARSLDLLNDRKQAIIDGLGGPDSAAGAPVTSEDYVRILSGFDLDPSELVQFMHRIVEHGTEVMAAEALEHGGVVHMGFVAGLWADGLAMGLLVGELRQRAEAASK